MTKKILLVLLVLLIVLNNGIVFAATDSYDAGYDAGYDYAYGYTGRYTSGSSVYSNNFRNSRKHRDIMDELGDDYVERDFREGFIDGFNDGYKADLEEGETLDYASELGKLLGEIYGARDYQNGKKSDWKKALPGRNTLRSMYKLDRQSAAYINAFVSEFNKAFEEGYNEAFEKAMFEPERVSLEQGIADGEKAGALLGAAFGAKDFYEGRGSLFYNNLPTESEIRRDFGLNKEIDDYEDGFIAGFIRAYEEAYNKAYREANMNNAEKKVTSEVIPIDGIEIVTADSRFAINVPAGTYYHDVNCVITTTFDAGTGRYGNLIKASDSYNVMIGNSSGIVDENQRIEIKFQYYGDKTQGGIYKWSGSGWLYVPTHVEDDMLIARINPRSLGSSGTTFSAFADTNFKVFRDARGHWASDEISAYVRRGIISGYGDDTFRPENNISRAEFLTLLSRVYNWNTYWYFPESTVTFKDSDTFGNYSNVIYYATRNNYIYGYSDGTFKPNNPISYAEVETIMGRVLPYSNFRWINIANDMLYDKKVRSNSFNDLNNYITRAEVAYMLYNLTE